MGCALAGHGLVAFIAERVEVEVLPEILARPHENRALGQMKLVDQPRLEILPNRGDASAQTHVLAAGCLLRLLERGLDAVGDEVEHGAALHLEGLARVMRQHEHRHVVRRLFAPPPLPVFVRPRSAHGAEHVAPEDPGADVLEAFLGHGVVDSGLAGRAAVHALEDARGEEPFHDLGRAHAERILEALIWAGAVAVERDAETLYAQFGHYLRPSIWSLSSRRRSATPASGSGFGAAIHQRSEAEYTKKTCRAIRDGFSFARISRRACAARTSASIASMRRWRMPW